MLSGIHPHIAEGMEKRDKLRSQFMWAICAIFTVALLVVAFTWRDHAQIHASNDTFTLTASHILSAYVIFTGKQFLIINKNQFAWTNVHIAVNSDMSQDHPIHETIDPRAFMLMVPSINSEEAYPVAVTQFRRANGTQLNAVTTRPEKIQIWSDTPCGRGFWYGRVSDEMVASHILSEDKAHHASER